MFVSSKMRRRSVTVASREKRNALQRARAPPTVNQERRAVAENDRTENWERLAQVERTLATDRYNGLRCYKAHGVRFSNRFTLSTSLSNSQSFCRLTEITFPCNGALCDLCFTSECSSDTLS